jgi:hypothetical protein
MNEKITEATEIIYHNNKKIQSLSFFMNLYLL